MNLDQLLTDTLHDDRLALPVPPGTLDRVRRRRRTRQRVTVAGTSVAALAGLTAVAGIGVALAPGGGGSRTARVASSPEARASGCEALPAGMLPGSSYVVRSARDWFMTKPQSDAFFSHYNQPSPKPQDSVPSPQPSGPGTDRLVAALSAAGVPGADTLRRDEADGGERGALTVEGALPDGRHLLVTERPSTFPFTISGYYGSDTEDSSKDVVIEDVPGTSCAALLLPARAAVETSSLVQVVAPDGTSTGWSSPDIPLPELRTWAYAAARWMDAHPA